MAARKVSQYAMELRSKNEQLARALEAARLAALSGAQVIFYPTAIAWAERPSGVS